MTSPGHPAEDSPETSTPCEATQTLDGSAAGHYIRTPDGGYTASGRAIDIEFSFDHERPQAIRFNLTWDAVAPTTEILQMIFFVYEGVPPHLQPMAEGRSPLFLEAMTAGPRLREHAYVHLGPTTNPGQDVTVSHTVLEQPVVLALVETYETCPA